MISVTLNRFKRHNSVQNMKLKAVLFVSFYLEFKLCIIDTQAYIDYMTYIHIYTYQQIYSGSATNIRQNNIYLQILLDRKFTL